MKSITVSSQKDLYAVKNLSQVCEEVIIDAEEIKHHGLIRHAVKYGLNALILDGRMVIKSSPFESYVLKKNKIDFWQIKYEVFGSLKDTVEIVEIDAKQGSLVLKKKKHLYNYSGISFGIVFSGQKQEEQQLISAINSINSIKALRATNYEILICGPTVYRPTIIEEKFRDLNIRYLPLDISTSPRIMICEKKNHLYEEASYSIVVISHCRILFPADFITGISKYPIEMATPSVYYQKDDQELKYLDLAFIGSYQDIQLGAKKGTIAGETIQEDYLHWYKNRVPVIDGGLNIFNKNVITKPPYNNYISWGEAEDVELCNRLYQDGVLIDYLPQIKCYSSTCKVSGYSSFKKIARKSLNFLNKKRLLK